eukprot:1855702-Lingulodinium_polyedra.AAC.1
MLPRSPAPASAPAYWQPYRAEVVPDSVAVARASQGSGSRRSAREGGQRQKEAKGAGPRAGQASTA